MHFHHRMNYPLNFLLLHCWKYLGSLVNDVMVSRVAKFGCLAGLNWSWCNLWDSHPEVETGKQKEKI